MVHRRRRCYEGSHQGRGGSEGRLDGGPGQPRWQRDHRQIDSAIPRRPASVSWPSERASTRIGPRRAKELVRADRRPRSLSEPVRTDAQVLGTPKLGVLGDVLADPLSDADHDEVMDRIAGTQVHALLSRLTERERENLAVRFGLDGREPERLVDIASDSGSAWTACAGSSDGRSRSWHGRLRHREPTPTERRRPSRSRSPGGRSCAVTISRRNGARWPRRPPGRTRDGASRSGA
jgi:hypothetical protein